MDTCRVHPVFLSAILLLSIHTHAQDIPSINVSDVSRIEKILASDEMQGRRTYTTGIEKAASYIIREFRDAGLQPFPGNADFRQIFTMNGSGSKTTGYSKNLTNLIGIIPGSTKPDEYVIFSAHYDHLGIGNPDASGDSIYNGANDDASGITAVIELANYFYKLHSNKRTIVFVAFTAEEIGEYGSLYFSKTIDAEKVVAMFNIEMIGTRSKWGANSAYITGYDKSNVGAILQKNVSNSSFTFYPDPYPQQKLFLRSDNAPLAKLGIPAHTISSAKMDSEKLYHNRGDEIETLDLDNMTEIIRAIGRGAGSVVSGADTPVRVRF
jgi:hypothetical protein